MAISLRLGGAERLITDLLPLLNERGVNSDLLLLVKTGSSFEREITGKGINIYHTGLNNEYSPGQIGKMAKFLKQKGKEYNLVHTHLFPPQYFLVFSGLLGRPKLPLVTTEHNTYNKRREKVYFRWLERLIYRKYSRIICISEPACLNLVRWLPELKAKTTVVPNGIDLKRFKRAKPYLLEELPGSLRNTDKVVLMVASMSRQKDQATVIKAASLLPDHYKFLFVGDGELKNDLIRQTKKLGLANRIYFLGLRDDVERLIKSADLFVLSSHWEGFGLVVLEAMAGGLPVIASDVPGLAGIVSGAGLLFKVGDEKQLAEKIKLVLNSDQMYLNLKKGGFERAEKYSLINMADKYKKIYEEVLEDE